jgi:hypothetical protein
MTVTEAEIEAALIAAEKLDWRTLRSTIKAALEAAAAVREGKKRGTRHDYHNLPPEWPLPQSFA